MNHQLLHTVIVLLIVVLTLSLPHTLHAQTASTTINATVKLNICGDNVVEGPEDCEGNNLNGKSCTNVGHTGGTLTCDISCSFDKTACTDFSTPTPTTSPTTVSEEPNLSPGITTTVLPTNLPQQNTTTKTIPQRLRELFGINTTTTISIQDAIRIIDLWKEARDTNTATDQQCDSNEDTICDLQDLSIILYYIE